VAFNSGGEAMPPEMTIFIAVSTEMLVRVIWSSVTRITQPEVGTGVVGK
jgi:hypothetical protein